MSVQFPVVHYKSVYKLIVGRPFTTSLDPMASLVHLKLKFHNLHGELVIVNANLEGAKKNTPSTPTIPMREKSHGN